MGISLENMRLKLEKKIQRKVFQPLAMVSYYTKPASNATIELEIDPWGELFYEHPSFDRAIGWTKKKKICFQFDRDGDGIVLFDDMTTALNVVRDSENEKIDYVVKLWDDRINMPTFIRVKYPFIYDHDCYGLVEALLDQLTDTMDQNTTFSKDNIIYSRVVFHHQKGLPMKYHLLELVVQDPKPVLERLRQLNISAYVLPVLCLRDALSTVVEHWLRTYTGFIDNKSRCCISTSAVCLDLILHFYGLNSNQHYLSSNSEILLTVQLRNKTHNVGLGMHQMFISSTSCKNKNAIASKLSKNLDCYLLEKWCKKNKRNQRSYKLSSLHPKKQKNQKIEFTVRL
ncbi:hypothetical protein RFI_01048 [Reticulomyxa filosa]|uniref:Uncharacterized protein n=1 Tax=Reticulomyxa filosa TaxID=46433 RepID=X6PD33_RETFI|nr:hypothetical protein RFI_01048 [Reticulomyxa filosa]|eukprot:ETO36018.1 hypothetical protein RFI_01048 [Reticulomyxa filosa]